MNELNDAVATTAQLVKDLHKPDPIIFEHPTDGTKAPCILAPAAGGGFELISVKEALDEYRDHPERREGLAKMCDLASFIAHVNRFKNDDSALFVDNSRQKPGLLAVIDYHARVNAPERTLNEETGEVGSRDVTDLDAPASFMRHRTAYDFPLSDEWKAWTDRNKKPMDQTTFSAFIEERALDLAPAPILTGTVADADLPLKKLSDLIRGKWANPTQMMELSRGLAIYESARVINATNINTGEGVIEFAEEHQDSEGKKLEVPNLFLIGIPVFLNGPLYRVVVRLRYRRNAGAIVWFYDLYRHDKVFDDAITLACNEAKDQTGLPLFVGFPES